MWCKYCGSDYVDYVGEDDGATLYHCPECGMDLEQEWSDLYDLEEESNVLIEQADRLLQKVKNRLLYMRWRLLGNQADIPF